MNAYSIIVFIAAIINTCVLIYRIAIGEMESVSYLNMFDISDYFLTLSYWIFSLIIALFWPIELIVFMLVFAAKMTKKYLGY